MSRKMRSVVALADGFILTDRLESNHRLAFKDDFQVYIARADGRERRSVFSERKRSNWRTSTYLLAGYPMPRAGRPPLEAVDAQRETARLLDALVDRSPVVEPDAAYTDASVLNSVRIQQTLDALGESHCPAFHDRCS